jgi:hypothetical protein
MRRGRGGGVLTRGEKRRDVAKSKTSHFIIIEDKNVQSVHTTHVLMYKLLLFNIKLYS